jgi:hypothetical protein
LLTSQEGGTADAVVHPSKSTIPHRTGGRFDTAERSRALPVTPISNDDIAQLDVIDQGLLSIAEADVLLEKFKNVKTPQFPFIVIPPGIDAATLRRQSPFLFLTIVTTCLEEDLSLQRTLGLEIRKVISRRVLFENDMNLEFLQGLVVHVCWFHYHFHPASKQMYMLLQMAVAIVTDLRLDRYPVSYPQRVGLDISKRQIKALGLADESKHSRTAAENRALLGCYYLCSG